jgi:IclR family acetate operon transcriptional repressor
MARSTELHRSKKGSKDIEESPSGLLERTLRVLELLAENAAGMQLYDIAQHLGIPRSATHRVLNSLMEHGYVRQERREGAYQLTAKITSLAFTFLARSGITDFAQPILDRLAAESGELARLAVINGKELIWVAKAQGSTHGLRYDPDMGQVARLSCSASGHAWLSSLSDEEALSLVQAQGFGARREYGPRAPETEEALLRHLRKARRQGFALVQQTYTPWANAVAVPILHEKTRDVSSVVVLAGPTMRFTEERMLALVPSLHAAARELALTPTTAVRGGRRPVRSVAYEKPLGPPPNDRIAVQKGKAVAL